MAALAPGATIGILGGGQLGRMLAMAAARLGFKTLVYEPAQDCPAAQVASDRVRAGFDDRDTLAGFARRCGVVTYEFENVPVEAAQYVAKFAPLRPGAGALAASQDRLAEKRFLAGLGISTAPYFDVTDLESLRNALGACGGRGILKTRRLGYDGKGQERIDSGADAARALAQLSPAPVILEGLVDFAREISIVAARGLDGSFAAFDPAENRHSGGILRSSTVPAGISRELADEAGAIARVICEALDYCGVIGVEFFVARDGGLIVNEIAPRVHNSGHWTEAACLASQFEQHVRAIAGLPLADPARHSDCGMENLIGADVERVPGLLAEGRALVHLYGKGEMRPGRKMGHFTRLTGMASRA